MQRVTPTAFFMMLVVDWGHWFVARGFASEYLFACAEFGTFGPVKVLAGLRAENQAHHWGNSESESTHRAKIRLKELFCLTNEPNTLLVPRPTHAHDNCRNFCTIG